MSALFGILCLLSITAISNGLAVSKTEALRPFRPVDPLRETVEFVGNSVSSLFAPFSPYVSKENINTNFPLVKSPTRLSKLRNFHRKHRWSDDDIAAAFEEHFVFRAPRVLQAAVEELQQINYDSDPANFVATGAVQAFSPIAYNNKIDNKALLPFNHQVKLSDLKNKMRHGHSYFE